MAILNMSQYHFCRLFKRFASGQHFVNDGCIAASPKQERPNLPQDSPRQATGVLDRLLRHQEAALIYVFSAQVICSLAAFKNLGKPGQTPQYKFSAFFPSALTLPC